MKNSAINRIKTFGKAGYIVTVFAKIFMILALVACMAAMIVLAVIPEDFVTLSFDSKAKVVVDLEAIGQTIPENFSEQLKFNDSGNIQTDANFSINGARYEVDSAVADGDKLNVEATAEGMQFSIHNLWWIVLAAIINVALTLVVVFFIGSLCKAFRDCSTPFEENIIKKMNNLGFSMIPMAFVSSITNSVIQSISSNRIYLNWNVDLTVVIAILLVFAMAYIFKYGAMLQQESDETL